MKNEAITYSVKQTNKNIILFNSDLKQVLKKDKNFLILINKRVLNLHRAKIQGLLNINSKNKIFSIKAGEFNKDFNNYKKIIEKMAKDKINKNTTLVVIGGGTVLDFGGFIAATYLRGINFISVPTNLHSISDCCVGGKVNLFLFYDL